MGIALTSAALTDACALFKHGRVSVDVDGLSEKCCSTMVSVFDKDLKKASNDGLFKPTVGAGNRLGPAVQQDEMEDMMAVMTNCCSASDQDVWSTLIPEEEPEAAVKLTSIC